jgi:hypothetical protein
MQLTISKNAKGVALAGANVHRDWNSVMVTDRCMFHFRYPGEQFGRARWVRRSKKEAHVPVSVEQGIGVQ